MIDAMIDGLNDRQSEAVQHDGNLLVLAGAGSGKTRVLTVKIGRKLNQGVRPDRILAVTFTNKAAKEMKGRLAQMHPLGAAVNMRTFHSFGSSFLRNNCTLIGRTKGFSIWNESNQASALKNIVNRDKQRFEKMNGSAEIKGKFADAASWISRIKDSSIDPVIDLKSHNATDAQTYLFNEYEKLIQKSNATDFSDLIRLSIIVMMKDKSLIPAYDHILVDELQDNNSSQFTLLTLLGIHAESITGVGDDDQAIYEWRGADAGNVRKFKDHFQAKLVKLEENYRSNPRIVNAANHLIQFNERRMGKNMIPVKEDGFPVYYMESEDQGQEAYRMATYIKALVEKNPDQKVAIIYRENRQSRKIEYALRRMSLTYILYKGVGFINRREITMMLNIFRLLVNYKDSQAFVGVVSHLGKGFGPATMAKVEAWQLSVSEEVFYSGEGIPLSAKKKQDYLEAIGYVSALKNKDLTEIGFGISPSMMEKLTTFPGDKVEMSIDREANIQELFIWMQEFQSEQPDAQLEDFMNEASLDTSSANDSDTATVHLMTVHGSKGLEFPVVFVAGCSQIMFPGNYANNMEFEESRRLLYVAMTRAEYALILSHAVFTHKGVSERSEFLDDINEHLTEV